MVVGDQKDILNRLIQQLPSEWFDIEDPILNAILQAYIGYSVTESRRTTMYFHYNYQYLYAQLQQRIQTATQDNLDLISKDYLGNELPRRAGENDDSYQQRIKANVLRPRATRQAMISAITVLTGYLPVIWEPWNGSDTGYLNISIPTKLALNTIGGLGTTAPYQAWIYVYLDRLQGMANYPGINTSPPDPLQYRMGLNIASGAGQLGNESLIQQVITQEDVLQLIEATKVLGTLMHVTFYYV